MKFDLDSSWKIIYQIVKKYLYMLTKMKVVLTFSKQGIVFPTVNRQFGGFGVSNISDDSKMKLKLSFELSRW